MLFICLFRDFTEWFKITLLFAFFFFFCLITPLPRNGKGGRREPLFHISLLTLCFSQFQYSNLKSSDVNELQKRQEILLANIRPNAVAVVDSFDFHDAILGSALGAYDGRVYERLFEEANKSPLNQEPVNESFHKYLKPFLKSNI